MTADDEAGLEAAADSPFDAAQLLGGQGPLAAVLPGFVPRAAQQQMADAVAGAIADASTLIVEAGTGTGKTFAYLVPALLSGQRVVVSTGTKSLQDQLFHRDLPRLLRALRVPARVSLLKGRGNYLCLHRLQRTRQQPGWRHDERLEAIDAWARRTTTGEMSELGTIFDSDPLYPRVTSTADNCLGAKCPDFGKCFVVKARRAAQGADLVVVNHHLMFADYALKEEGFGEIMPNADAVIVDEAHQLPELASQFFGSRVSTRQLRDLAQDALDEAGNWGDMPDLESCSEELSQTAQGLESAFAVTPARMTFAEFLPRPGFARLVDALAPALEEQRRVLEQYRDRTPVLEALADRASALLSRWQLVVDDSEPQSEDGRVRWVEPRGRGGSFNTTPIELAEAFGRLRTTLSGAWVFTSATLSAAGDFGHYQRELGLGDARTLALDSPFDFPRQTRLYLPSGLPEPNDPAYTDRCVERMIPLIQASGGGAFVLCTSHRALKRVAERLRQALGLPLFVQGEDERSSLVERFARDGDGVLVGTASFWEGVDVKGRALRLVIIDRLPFTAPGDPVFEARLDAIRRRGGSPFAEHQLPEAIVMLRQGVGRLIRDAEDRGLVVLCDPRVRSKNYGRRVIASLPDMPQVDERGALDWLHELARR